MAGVKPLAATITLDPSKPSLKVTITIDKSQVIGFDWKRHSVRNDETVPLYEVVFQKYLDI